MSHTISPSEAITRRDYAWVPGRGSLTPELVRPASSEAQAWARLPCRWILDGGLRLFRDEVAYRGRSAAALKMLLTIALKADQRATGLLAGERVTALLSYEDLNRLSGLSTILISAGKKFLCGHGLVEVTHEGQGRRNRYFLGSSGRFEPQALIPCRHPIEPETWTRIEKLNDLSCTQLHDLNALKIYLILCALDGGRDLSVALRPSIVSELTNIAETKIPEALDNLARRSLVSMQPAVQGRDADLVRIKPLSLQ